MHIICILIEPVLFCKLTSIRRIFNIKSKCKHDIGFTKGTPHENLSFFSLFLSFPAKYVLSLDF